MQSSADFAAAVRDIPADKPVLIAGPTASGKSALAIEIAQTRGGIIVNADASQVYDCWQVITARPSAEEEAQAPHLLYGHVAATAPYSAGHWLREVIQILNGPERAIIIGGTGLYFKALTEGLVEMPATPPDVRKQGDAMPLAALLDGIDEPTLARIDQANRARVQRAWEVQQATGKGLAAWQDQTPPPPLPLSDCTPIAVNAETSWLNDRIARRFDIMLREGALAEVAAVRPLYDPNLPAHRAIGVPELMAHLNGEMTLEQAKERAIIATRQYAKRQRTWLRRRMKDWKTIHCP